MAKSTADDLSPISPLLLLLLLVPHVVVSLSTSPDIHDLLPTYGFPKGLLPNAVVSYSISSDEDIIVKLSQPCYVEFDDDQVVYYGKEIHAKLRYGSVTQVSGIQAKKLFLWVTVTGMTLDSGSDMIVFHVGPLSRKLPANQFHKIPDCQNKKKTCHHSLTLTQPI